jgi:hypothetical protein
MAREGMLAHTVSHRIGADIPAGAENAVHCKPYSTSYPVVITTLVFV